ncbi:hypothetical protein BC826DRAFT_1110226 [Russula brevipes]|nr:hypothetical protein BC826DRAFT_1110226 [Russula brevipes]
MDSELLATVFVGRTSTFSTAATRIVTAILLAGFIPGAAACWTDSDGYEYCYRVNPVGIIAGSIAFFFLLSLAIFLRVRRRRRIAAANQALIQQAHRIANANQNPYGGIPPQGFPSPQVAPQYPPQVHNGAASPYMTSVSQSATLPPQYVAPSPGVAPIQV